MKGTSRMRAMAGRSSDCAQKTMLSAIRAQNRRGRLSSVPQCQALHRHTGAPLSSELRRASPSPPVRPLTFGVFPNPTLPSQAPLRATTRQVSLRTRETFSLPGRDQRPVSLRTQEAFSVLGRDGPAPVGAPSLLDSFSKAPNKVPGHHQSSPKASLPKRKTG